MGWDLDRGRAKLEPVAKIMAEVLDWNDAQLQEQLQRVGRASVTQLSEHRVELLLAAYTAMIVAVFWNQNIVLKSLTNQLRERSAEIAQKNAELEQASRMKSKFLAAMYGSRPNLWDPGLRGLERLRFITNCLTRVRFVHADGRLDFDQKGQPDAAPAGLAPWFDMPDRATESVRIVFGHWSTLGLLQRPGLLGLDTGCVWGGSLTAARLTGPIRVVFEESTGYRKPKNAKPRK